MPSKYDFRINFKYLLLLVINYYSLLFKKNNYIYVIQIMSINYLSHFKNINS